MMIAMPVLAEPQSYRKGFSAYLEQDYDQAQQYWLTAATEQHARAMFNLGLLHEQGKIAEASSEKADNWFTLASKHGYAPADYHLGLRWLAQGGRDELANQLIADAAKAGYAPALRRTQGGTERSKTAIAKTATAGAVSKTSTPSQAADPNYLGEKWIKAKNPEHWTIQMLAFKSHTSVESFIDEHQLRSNAAYFAEETDEGRLFKLVYGAYDSKDKAELARQNLSAALTEFGPWLRPISSVHAVIQD